MIKFAAAFCAVATALAASAQADPVIRPLAQGDYTINHRDLDLSTTSGRRGLLRRVSIAARRICEASALEYDQRACRRWVLSATLEHASPAQRQALEAALSQSRSTSLAAR